LPPDCQKYCLALFPDPFVPGKSNPLTLRKCNVVSGTTANPGDDSTFVAEALLGAFRIHRHRRILYEAVS